MRAIEPFTRFLGRREAGRSVALPSAPPELAPADLVSFVWRFGRTDGSIITDRLRLLPDGRILGASPDEAGWTLADGRLRFHAADGTPTTTFEAEPGRGAAIRFSGPFHAPFEGRTVVHTLRPALDDLHVSAELRGLERPTVVTFASAGSPFRGDDTRWEYYRFADEVGANHIRCAEHQDLLFWYLNKTRRILAMLEALLPSSAWPVVMCGMSSGGFAAHLFAELLAQRRPDLAIVAVSINPQLAIGPVHDARVAACAPENFRPAMIGADNFAQRDIAVASIAEAASGSIAEAASGSIAEAAASGSGAARPRHIVHYDRANPCEAYQVAQGEGVPGLAAIPYDLGLPHGEGIGAIFREGTALADMRAALGR